jgi:hypothetical protein
LGFSFLNSSLVLKWHGVCAVLRVKDYYLGPLSFSGKKRYFIIIAYISCYWFCKGIFFEKEVTNKFVTNKLYFLKILESRASLWESQLLCK